MQVYQVTLATESIPRPASTVWVMEERVWNTYALQRQYQGRWASFTGHLTLLLEEY